MNNVPAESNIALACSCGWNHAATLFKVEGTWRNPIPFELHACDRGHMTITRMASDDGVRVVLSVSDQNTRAPWKIGLVFDERHRRYLIAEAFTDRELTREHSVDPRHAVVPRRSRT